MRGRLPALVEFVLLTITLDRPPLPSSAQGSAYTTLRKHWFYGLPRPQLALHASWFTVFLLPETDSLCEF